MKTRVERLMRLTGWGGRNGPPYDWDRARAELGTDLPRDYIELVETFGCGRFDDTIFLVEPGCSRPYFDLVKVTMERRKGLRLMLQMNEAALTEDEVASSVRSLDGDPLITWAVTDYGLDFHWRCSPRDQPDRWPVVAVVLGEDWYEYDMRATEFLEGLLAGLIEHPSWDPVERHSFTSLNHLPGEESATSSVGGVVWLPEVLVRIDPADDHLDLDALLGWLWDDEALNEASTSIGTIRSAQTNNRTVVEVTLRDFRGLPVLGASVAAWMRANKVLLTATLTRDDATTSVESATPEAVEELIRTLGTVE